MFGKTLYSTGNSPLELLPNELLFRIFDMLATQNPPVSSTPRSWFMLENLPTEPNAIQQTRSLLSYLLVSHRLHHVALPLLYRDVKLVQDKLAAREPHQKLLRSIDENPDLAPLVWSLDITEYQNTSDPCFLLRALSRLPRLRSLHLQLANLKSIRREDIQKIFFGLPDLETLVIENSSGTTDPAYLAQVLRTLEDVDQNMFSNIRSLTCRSDSGTPHTWPSHAVPFVVDDDLFRNFLFRFPKIRALDLAFTSIDPEALLAIDSRARLQYLRITDCQDNDTSMLARFLSSHPAVKNSLVVLDCRGVRFGEQDTTRILENLPPALRSLDLSSSTMTASHVPHLQRLFRHLEEVSLGHGLLMENVETAILGPRFQFDSDEAYRPVYHGEGRSKDPPEHELILGPMRDAIAICKLRRRLASVSLIPSRALLKRSLVRYLDLSSMDEDEQGRITNSVLLGQHSTPLEGIVVSGIKSEDYRVLRKVTGGCGWRDRWVNGMVWVERR